MLLSVIKTDLSLIPPSGVADGVSCVVKLLRHHGGTIDPSILNDEFCSTGRPLSLGDIVNMGRRVGLICRVCRIESGLPSGACILHLKKNTFITQLYSGPPRIIYDPLVSSTIYIDNEEEIDFSGYFVTVDAAFPVIEHNIIKSYHMWLLNQFTEFMPDYSTIGVYREKYKKFRDKCREGGNCNNPESITIDHLPHINKEISLNTIRELHRLIMGPDHPGGGILRDCDLSRGSRLFVKHNEIVKYLNSWINAYYSPPKSNIVYDHIVYFCKLLSDLNAIHPFYNGNGRLVSIIAKIPWGPHKLSANLDLIEKTERYSAAFCAGIGNIDKLLIIILKTINNSGISDDVNSVFRYSYKSTGRIDILAAGSSCVIRAQNILSSINLKKLERILEDKEKFFVASTVLGGENQKRNSTVYYNGLDCLPLPIFDEIKNLGLKAANLLKIDNDQLELTECQFTHTPSGGYFNAHSDNGREEVKNRKLTFVLYLSDEKKFFGGNLIFYRSSSMLTGMGSGPLLSLPPLRNSIVFFSSDLIHEVDTVISSSTVNGKRTTVNGWFHTKKVK